MHVHNVNNNDTNACVLILLIEKLSIFLLSCLFLWVDSQVSCVFMF